jgi:hypothetical protein
MKKYVVLVMIMVLTCSINITAQYHFITGEEENFVYNRDLKHYELVNNVNKVNFFLFNKDFTYLKLSTENSLVVYTLIFSKVQDNVNAWEYNVTDQSGNEACIIIDLENNNIRFVYVKNETIHLDRFNIKEIIDKNEKN